MISWLQYTSSIILNLPGRNGNIDARGKGTKQLDTLIFDVRAVYRLLSAAIHSVLVVLNILVARLTQQLILMFTDAVLFACVA